MREMQVPFDENGMQSYPETYARGFCWKDNYEFEDTLVVNGYYRGRSAGGLCLVGPDNAKYTMFFKDMEEMISRSLIDHGVVRGLWTFVKRGSNYGLQLVEPKSIPRV